MILFLGGAHLAYTAFTHKFNPTKCITRPAIGEIVVTSDGFVLTGVDDDLGGNHFLGTYADLLRNWLALIAVAGLTKEERITADSLFASKIGYFGRADA